MSYQRREVSPDSDDFAGPVRHAIPKPASRDLPRKSDKKLHPKRQPVCRVVDVKDLEIWQVSHPPVPD